MRALFVVALGFAGVMGCHGSLSDRGPSPPPSFWPACALLHRGTFVDLTHAFDEDIPHFKAFPRMTVKELFRVDREGFWVQQFNHVGQWGTHVDPPAHFHEHLRTVDQIPVEQMVMPLVVIDVHEKVARDPNYGLSLADVRAWEAQHSPIPAGAFVAMRTDWSKRWPDNDAMQNKDDQGVAHYPGWTIEALKYLYEARNVTATGHETTDTDPGISTSRNNYECERYILGRNHYQIELLTGLDKVPPTGAIVVCAFPKPRNCSGFPARVFAIVPPSSR